MGGKKQARLTLDDSQLLTHELQAIRDYIEMLSAPGISDTQRQRLTERANESIHFLLKEIS